MGSRVVARRVAQQLAGAAVALAVSILTAWWLGPEGKGSLAMALLIGSVVAQLCTIGLHDAASFLTRRQGIGLGSIAQAFDRHVIVAGLPVACAAALIAYSYGGVLWSHALPASLAVLTALLIACRLASLLYNGLLQAAERFNTIALLDFSDAILPSVLWCVGAVIFGPSVGLALGSFVLAAAFTAIASRVAVARITAGSLASGAPLRARTLARYGSKTYLRQMGMIVAARGHLFLVAHLVGLSGAGVYSVATTLADVVVRFPDAVAWMLMPRAAGLSDDKSRIATARYARVSLVIAVLICGPYFVAAHILIRLLLPEEFADASAALAFLLPGVAASSISKVLSADFVGRGKAGTVAALTWITVAAIVSFDLVLIPRLGLAGAALGSSIGQILGAVIFARAYSAEAGMVWRELVCVQQKDWTATVNAVSGNFVVKILRLREVPRS